MKDTLRKISKVLYCEKSCMSSKAVLIYLKANEEPLMNFKEHNEVVECPF